MDAAHEFGDAGVAGGRTFEALERLDAGPLAHLILESSVLNSEALWRALASARGHRVVDGPAWVVVDAEDFRGTRVILRRPVTGALQLTALHHIVKSASQIKR